MPYNPNIHHRRSIRLHGYDYSQEGLYFITICVQDRACLFGKIVVGVPLVGAQNVDAPTMELNDAGKMLETEWLKLPERFTNIELHEYVVMPNHFHAILEIVGATLVVAPNNVVAINDLVAPNNNVASNNDDSRKQNGQPQGIAPTTNAPTIGDMMDAFKSISTVEYIRGVKTMNWQPFNGKLWQRNYYEHIIRDEQSYQRIAEYIINNPAKWADDKFYNE